jgi:hypothetical protein
MIARPCHASALTNQEAPQSHVAEGSKSISLAIAFQQARYVFVGQPFSAIPPFSLR